VVQFRELDDRVPFANQRGESGGPAVFMNTFHVAPDDVDGFHGGVEGRWRVHAETAGLISTQLHRGIARSTTFIKIAEWESADAFRAAATNPEFRATLSRYPDRAVASPHIFTRVAVPGICGD
jgi:heme-degrading monooxygenase HmoA